MIIIPPPLPPLRDFKGGGDSKEIHKILDRMDKIHEAFVEALTEMLVVGSIAVLLMVGGGALFLFLR